MKKISEEIKHFESRIKDDPRESYYEDQYAYRKVYDLKIMLDALGDVKMSDDELKTYLFKLFNESGKGDVRKLKTKLKTIYDLLKDQKFDEGELYSLFTLYNEGIFKLKYEEIKDLIDSDIDFREGYSVIEDDAIDYAKEEAKKLEYLKEDYQALFVRRLQSTVKKRFISSDGILEMLPSKEFVQQTSVTLPLGYDTLTGQDIVFKRISDDQFEEYYQELDDDEIIRLGYCSTGDPVYSTFTKGEYKQEIKQKTLKR